MHWRPPISPRTPSRAFGRAAKARKIGLKAAALAAGCLIGTADASAEAKVNIAGIGAASCHAFMNETQSDAQAERTYFAWAQGYMSGIMMRAPPGVDEGINLLHPSFPLQQQADFVRAFCSGNPQADYSDGVLELYRELRRRSSL